MVTQSLGDIIFKSKNLPPPPEPPNFLLLDDLLARAWAYGSAQQGISDAQDWAKDEFGIPFHFSPEDLRTDADQLAAAGNDLDVLISRRQQRLTNAGRLSRESIAKTLNPATIALLEDERDINRLYELADGVQMPTSPAFTPQQQPEALRPRFKLLMPTVHKLLNKQRTQGSILLLPTVSLLGATRSTPLHFQSLGWTSKKGEPSGRVTGDMTYTEWPYSLNGKSHVEKDQVRTLVEDKWGPINLPTLHDIVTDILLMADTHDWTAISLFKKDIAAAFHRLFFHPASVPLTAFALDDQHSILHLVGNFGWTGMPNAWDVVGRVMLAASRTVIHGTLRLYVDDFFGACRTEHLQANNAHVDNVIKTLLGTALEFSTYPFGGVKVTQRVKVTHFWPI